MIGPVQTKENKFELSIFDLVIRDTYNVNTQVVMSCKEEPPKCKTRQPKVLI